VTVALASRSPVRLAADPSRVITRLFVPGHDLSGNRDWQASTSVRHILDLDDADVADTLEDVLQRIGGRHRDLMGTLRRNAGRIGTRLGPELELSEARLLLLGAAFTQEFAVEGAALCNPSMVAHPDQSGAPAGSLRFLMSVRQIGEGHHSCIGFRSGTVGPDGHVEVDPPTRFSSTATTTESILEASTFRDAHQWGAVDGDAADWVLGRLGEHFTVAELESRLAMLEQQRDTRRDATGAVRRFRELASRRYVATFPPDSEPGERVLHPAIAVESRGMEDARFVRFVEDDGSVDHRATYTAFDGSTVAQQLLTTEDFCSFTASPVLGPAAANKGLALFPRRIDGRFVALTRHDGATNGVARSDDIGYWDDITPLEHVTAPWESLQMGNCGPPIETDAGWLVLTHGVGPMRTYSIGALLLDLEDPTRVVGRLRAPLLETREDERYGYVPHVLYSCGGVVHDGLLWIPYGASDQRIRVAWLVLDELVTQMRADGASTAD
jgi:predicted GH43/DUF377 family glycosyl hydrolase